MLRTILVLLAAVIALPSLTTDADARPKQRRTDTTTSSYDGSYGSSYSNAFNSSYGESTGSSDHIYRPRTKQQRTAQRTRYRESERMSLGYTSPSSSSYSGVGPRPSAWCGWWMRTQRGGGPEFNVAWNWRNYGSAASPQVGAVVVWRHHVGQIVGQASDGRWLIQSGNDGGAVRTRPRSISGAVIRM